MKKKPSKKKTSREVSTNDGAPKKFNPRPLIVLAINTTVILGVYLAAMRFYYFEYTLAAYIILAAGISVGYVVYNRGFSRRGITLDMLPDTMTPEEKSEFIADGERRMKKSKWMLTIILPFIFTFAYEFITLFLVDLFKSLFS